MPTPSGEMRLGEAIEVLRRPEWGCACVGGAGCCFVQYRKAVELQRGALIAVKLLAGLEDRHAR